MGKQLTLQERLLILKETAETQSTISYRSIIHILSGKGRLLIFMVLTLPFCVFLAIPGLSVPFGLIIGFMGIGMIFRKNIWLPSKLLSKQIKTSSLKKIIVRTLRLLKKMEVWTHPRMRWLSNRSIMRVINGIIISLSGFILALPIPIHFTNTTAAWTCFVLSFGIIEEDGVFIILGYLIFLITLIIYFLLAETITALV